MPAGKWSCAVLELTCLAYSFTRRSTSVFLLWIIQVFLLLLLKIRIKQHLLTYME